MTPLVYWVATRMLTTTVRIPRTPDSHGRPHRGMRGRRRISRHPDGTITIIAYAVFAFGVLTVALVDAVERRIPNRITYPLLAVGVLGVPWLTSPITAMGAAGPINRGGRFRVYRAAQCGPC